MAKEIERKFLIPLKHHGEFLERQGVEITQAYLSQDVDRTVRVRLVRPAPPPSVPLCETATLTIKGRSTQGGLLRPEWEFALPVQCAEEMIAQLHAPVLYKTRHFLDLDGDKWVVDVLRVNTVADRPPMMWRYLVLAEFEADTLEAVNAVKLPHWLGAEVTNDPTYSMSALTTEAAREAAWCRAYAKR